MAWSIPKTKSIQTLTRMLDVTTQVLTFIAKVTKNTTDDRAVVVLAAIRAAISAAEKGFDGKVEAAAVRDELAKLHTAIIANDLSAVDRLKKKFGRS